MDGGGSVYMVRDAAFGLNFTPKVVLAIIALVLVLWDIRRQRRLDYLWVFVTATVVWAVAEGLLQMQGIRAMPRREVLGMALPLAPSYVIQGMGEAAFVAVLGLFIGDRWLFRPLRTRATWGLVVSCVLIAAATARSGLKAAGQGQVASRRDMVDGRALAFLGVATALVVIFWWLYPRWRPRLAAMAAVMAIVATVWTIGQVATGGRWVEVGGGSAGFRAAGALVSFLALAFDVVIEIVVVYLPFLAIPVMLRLVRNPEPVPEFAKGEPVSPA